MKPAPSKPTLPPDFQKLVDESNLHLVLCGGLCVGNYTQPQVWLLKDKDSKSQIEEKTGLLMRLAGAMRYLELCKPYLPLAMMEKVEAFQHRKWLHDQARCP